MKYQQTDLRFNMISVKIPLVCSIEFDKIILKHTWTKVQFILLNIKTYSILDSSVITYIDKLTYGMSYRKQEK